MTSVVCCHFHIDAEQCGIVLGKKNCKRNMAFMRIKDHQNNKRAKLKYQYTYNVTKFIDNYIQFKVGKRFFV